MEICSEINKRKNKDKSNSFILYTCKREEHEEKLYLMEENIRVKLWDFHVLSEQKKEKQLFVAIWGVFTSLFQLCFLSSYPWSLGTFRVFVIPLYLSCRPLTLHQPYCQLFLIPEFLGTNEGSEITGQNGVTAESSVLY